MNRNDTLDAALRRLDAASPAVDPVRLHTRSDLDAIVATDPVLRLPQPGRAATVAVVPPRRRRPVRRVAVLGGLAAVATAALVMAPGLTGGDRAFATWTATPDSLSVQQRDAASASCRQSQVEGAGSASAENLEAAGVAVAERRGVWTTVLLAGTEGFSALCISDDSAGLFTGSWIGSVGTTTLDVPGPRELVATDLGSGTIGSNDLSLAAGAAGADVVGVAYVSQEHGAVSATVARGRFALWFPGDELVGASRGVDVQVTFEDGTTATTRLSL